LRQCLGAIFDQGFKKEEFQVLISDAGSSDKTIDIAAEFGVHVFSDPGRSRGKGRNFFVHNAGADILVMVDSDEVLPPDWLKTVQELFNSPEVVEVTGPYYTPEPKVGLVGKVIYELTSGWEFKSKSGRKREGWP